jgi:hypothetical protein
MGIASRVARARAPSAPGGLSRTEALYIRVGPLYTHRVFGSKWL